MKIHLTRHLGYHLVQTYIPSMVFVTLSWMALFVSAENIPGNDNMALHAINILRNCNVLHPLKNRINLLLKSYNSGRVGMGMTTLLTLIAMFGATKKDTPKVSYISYLDIWMLACIIFVFVSMIEFVVVHQFFTNNQKRQAENVEFIMRIMISIVFVGFNIIYWSLLL